MNTKKYAIIGAGPAGLAGARALKKLGIEFDGYEAHSDVGGLWNINNPLSTVYESAHLISSKKKTEFTEFPMKSEIADFPNHRELCQYFQDYATAFGLKEHYQFNTKVITAIPHLNEWELSLSNGHKVKYAGVIIASGTLNHPNIPSFKGEFTGEMVHSASYKSPAIFEGKKVLIVGAGNSGCDIAVDAVHRADSVAMSVRRGYHFVPKYVFGRPADTIGGKFKLPPKLKQKVEGALLKVFMGKPEDFGFPKPDHELYECHPVVNSLVLHHVGHGDIVVKADIDYFEGKTVHFKDGKSEMFDLILLATGYKLSYPFMDKKYLNWGEGPSPQLYLNIFSPHRPNLFVLGLIEAAGIGWQGRAEQAALVAAFIKAFDDKSPKAIDFLKLVQKNNIDLSGGYNYMKLDRMAYYVHTDTYRESIRAHLTLLED